MTTLREAAQKALGFTLRDFKSLRDFEAARAVLHDALRDALAQQTEAPCDIAEDGVCEVIDCCRNPAQQEQEPVAQMRENVLARWAHEQEEPPNTDWQRGYEAARRWVRQVGLPSLAPSRPR